MEEERLQKFMAECGIGSRRKCEEYISRGLVSVNGDVVTELGTKVDPERDTVMFQGKALKPLKIHTTVVLNKPAGYVTTAHDQFGRPNVTELIDMPEVRLYPVGRLDYQTTGLLLLTNDGDLAYYLTHPGHHVPKVYRAKVQGQLDEADIARLESGVVLDDGTRTGRSKIKIIREQAGRQAAAAHSGTAGSTTLEITIYEGKNHEIRRMMKAVSHPVLELKRIQEGPLRLGSLKEGAYRVLSDREVAILKGASQHDPR